MVVFIHVVVVYVVVLVVVVVLLLSTVDAQFVEALQKEDRKLVVVTRLVKVNVGVKPLLISSVIVGVNPLVISFFIEDVKYLADSPDDF